MGCFERFLSLLVTTRRRSSCLAAGCPLPRNRLTDESTRARPFATPGTVVVIGPDDFDTVRTTCNTSPPPADLNNCDYNIPTKGVWVAGIAGNNTSLGEVSGGAERVDCYNNGQVTAVHDTDNGFAYPPGVLSRWRGSLKIDAGRGCGAAVLVGKEHTAALGAVPLTSIKTMTYRGYAAKTPPTKALNWNMQFDFDTDVTLVQCGDTPCTAPIPNYDTKWQVRVQARVGRLRAAPPASDRRGRRPTLWHVCARAGSPVLWAVLPDVNRVARGQRNPRLLHRHEQRHVDALQQLQWQHLQGRVHSP